MTKENDPSPPLPAKSGAKTTILPGLGGGAGDGGGGVGRGGKGGKGGRPLSGTKPRLRLNPSVLANGSQPR